MKQTIREGEDLVIVARPTAQDQTVITDAWGFPTDETDTVSISIYDLSVPDNASENPVYTDAATTADEVLLSSLTLDGYWTRDSIGYTFLLRITPTEYAMEGGHTYRVSCKLPQATNGGTNYGDIYVDAVVTVSPRGDA